MIAFPNCKINLGLNLVRKRTDGFHDLETIFYPLPLWDAVEVLRRPETVGFTWQPGETEKEQASMDDAIAITVTGLPVAGAATSNLCYKAYQLLKHDFPQLPPVNLHLHKGIPMGAGLGGGSADGSFTLQLLNNKFQLNLSTARLLAYAAQLGSDCPFFLYNQPCFATGRGELLEPIALDLSHYTIVLVQPDIHISTAWAFQQITPAIPGTSIRYIIQQPVHEWRNRLVNDFEAPVCRLHPALLAVKEQLYQAGAIYAAMSGSGSCFFGLFQAPPLAGDLHFSYPYRLIRPAL